MYWCSNCMEAVEPEYGWTNIQGDESIREAFCPFCGRSLHMYADYCPLCGEPKPDMWESCPNCRAIIGVTLDDLAKQLTGRKEKVEAWDAIGEVFDWKYDLYYKVRKKKEEAK